MAMTSSAIAQTKEAKISIDPGKTYQAISNFSASDAWACQFVGNWPDAKRNAIADLLFSTQNKADGSPKGIGLNMWRFNIGAGSTEQGSEGGIRDEWHRAESFYNADGFYNWQKQAGQLWFLKAAKERGVKEFLGFTNSPPVKFTINGRAFADKGKVNIAPEKYIDFATYLADVVKGVEKTAKIKFNYISPFNEPQWDWSDNKQEGSPYTNAEIAGAVKVMDKVFTNRKIKSKLIIAEAGQINYLYTKSNKPGKGMQIADFFRLGSANYIGNLPTVAHTVTAHSYFTTSPLASSIKMRKALADSVAAIKGLDFWQSEYCILGDNAGEINGNKRDLGMDAALYMASVIHTDLAVANASAWQWWLAISAYDYKDGLIYVDKNKTDGNFYTSKMLWVLGNYSRFIKPGSVRVDVSVLADGLAKPLMVSAYKKGRELVIVVVNQNTEEVNIDLADVPFKAGQLSSYVTSQIDELKLNNVNSAKVNIPKRAVVTLTGKLTN
ncbi:xylanase [Mucilaginibacter myungsuensis]|uniref:Xylanase n=2 Tax=Mucilaginibacter myungsuensis TaxID=649104 RepID=A0A929KU69_9SPHI|nr:xylanase [Mucilaginibacter myungsuensis]